LLVSQYKTRPDEKFIKMKVKIIGINIIIFAWAGSPGGGDIFCCNNMLAPIIIVKIGMPYGGCIKGMEKLK
jgi:hypothetical protein